MLLPKMLRSNRPSDKIGFFLHITFPEIARFKKLKRAKQLIHGLLGADLIGFHTIDYTKHFLDSTYELTSATPIEQGIALRDRAVRVGVFPIGIDYIKFSSAVKTKTVQQYKLGLRRRYFGRKIILTVDRFDPTKGFMERLKAYEEFLKTNPALRGKVVMLMLAIPSRGEIDVYKQLKKNIETKIKKINRTYGTQLWKPIEYMYKSVSFEELSAMYQIADVAFVAPLRDGMNLVAKEYVASQGRKKGMLILSQTAGAAKELQDALLVDHTKPKTLVSALKQALTMQPAELKTRIGNMQKTLSLNTIYDWAGNFMGTLNQPVPLGTSPKLTKLRQENLAKNYKGAQSRLLIYDYDGVLTPFVNNPIEAKPTPEILKMLKKQAAQKNTTVAIVSGRSQKDLQAWFGRLPVYLAAEHGATLRKPGKPWKQLAGAAKGWKRIIKPALEKHADDTPGAFVEEKDFALVWHYRSASPYFAQKNIAILKAALKPVLKQFGLKLYNGNKIIEIKNPNINKSLAVRELLKKPYDFMMAIGDDYTDEDMFRTLPRRAYTIKVGPGVTKARYRLDNPKQVQKMLSDL